MLTNIEIYDCDHFTKKEYKKFFFLLFNFIQI